MYHYAGNNPVKYVDPDGNDFYSAAIKVSKKVLKKVVKNAAAKVVLSSLDGPLPVGDGIALIWTIYDIVKDADELLASDEESSNTSSNNQQASAAAPSPLPPDPDDEDKHQNNNQSAKDSKKIDSNKEANKFAQDKGYRDAHDLKKNYVGKNNISKYDIYRNNTTGESFLINKNGTVIVPIE